MNCWLHLHNMEPEQMVELAILAETLGFEGVVGDDHWFMPADALDQDPNERGPLPADYLFPDIFVAGSAILSRTKTLKFGSCIMVLANRTNPFLVAKAAATLARVGQDRFIMGIGTGWLRDEYAMAGVEWRTRIPRTLEMIEILRKLWGPGPVEHHGAFFNFPRTYASPRPHRQIPVYMGAVAPAALRRAGEIADGWMGVTTKLADLPAQIDLINQGRREAGRESQDFEFMVGLTASDGGAPPGLDEYRRAADLGVTQIHFGPIEHVLGKAYPSFDEKRRVVEDFADRIIQH